MTQTTSRGFGPVLANRELPGAVACPTARANLAARDPFHPDGAHREADRLGDAPGFDYSGVQLAGGHLQPGSRRGGRPLPQEVDPGRLEPDPRPAGAELHRHPEHPDRHLGVGGDLRRHLPHGDAGAILRARRGGHHSAVGRRRPAAAGQLALYAHHGHFAGHRPADPGSAGHQPLAGAGRLHFDRDLLPGRDARRLHAAHGPAPRRAAPIYGLRLAAGVARFPGGLALCDAPPQDSRPPWRSS